MAENMLVIDATDLLLGRFATVVAREALHGKDVRIINCEKALISGRKRQIIDAWKRKYGMGVPMKGPFIHRRPDRIVRRVIRGMLPHKTIRGREAFKRVMCYIGTPTELANAKAVSIETAQASKLPNVKYLSVGTIAQELGGKWNGQ